MGSRSVRGTLAVVMVVVAGAIMAGPVEAATTAPSDVGPVGWSSGSGDPNLGVLNQGSRTADFDSGWRFKLVNPAGVSDPSGAYGTSADPKAAAVGFSDAAWQPLTLPHDWSITQLPDPSQSNATGFFPGGLGWYRKTFTLPQTMTGKRISLDFDGVFDNSYVYLNGQPLGNHPYGYTGYSYDVSNLVHTDGHTPNTLAVVVQNQEPSSRWYSGSGITRHVHLTVTDPVHIARWGTSVTTPQLADSIKSHYATVHVATDLANDTGQATSVDLRYLVKDAGGNVVAQGTSPNVAVPTGGGPAAADLRVDNPGCGRRPIPTSTPCRPRSCRAARRSIPARARSGSAGWCSARRRACPSTGSPSSCTASTCTTTRARSGRSTTTTPCGVR